MGAPLLVALSVLGVSPAAFAQSSPPDPAPEQSVWDAPEPWRTDRFFLATSVYTKHFSYNPEHNDHQHLIEAEWNVTGQWLAGLSLFDNSFDQSSQYVYGGYKFRPLESAQPLYLKLTAGIVHGYRGQYQDKIPFNSTGFAPAIIPSLGYCLNRFCSELVVFGAAGVMVNVGVTIP
jgi:hypothetical protein